MYYVIELKPIALDLVEFLNDGVRPVADPNHVYVYRGSDKYAEIMTWTDFIASKSRETYVMVRFE